MLQAIRSHVKHILYFMVTLRKRKQAFSLLFPLHKLTCTFEQEMDIYTCFVTCHFLNCSGKVTGSANKEKDIRIEDFPFILTEKVISQNLLKGC